MNLHDVLENKSLVLTEASITETLRRSGEVILHPRLEHALLIYDENGKRLLSGLYEDYIAVARDADVPIAVCAPTWRANRERLSLAGISSDVNGDDVQFVKQLREGWGSWAANIFIGGVIGCKNDCYKPEEGLSTQEAKAFHSRQIDLLCEAGVEFVQAATLPAVPEAKGIALALAETEIPYIISFVIGREGRILDENSLEDAFGEIDSLCRRPPLGFMVNCAYPSFLNAQRQPRDVLSRLIGFQANGSSLDHTQLDGSATLKADSISDWGDRMIELNRKYGVKILGGCCGTNRQHLQYIVQHID